MVTFEYFDVDNSAAYEAYVDIHNRDVPDEKTSVWFEQRMDRLWNSAFLKKKALIRLNEETTASGRVIGYVTYGEPSWSPGPGKYFAYGAVDKQFRERGVGAAAYDWLMNELAPRDPVALEVETGEDRPAGIRFLERRGYQMMTRETKSTLDPATFDPQPFLESFDRVASTGLELIDLNELRKRFPEMWLRKLYVLENEIDKDIPWHDEITPQPFGIYASHYNDNRELLPEGYMVALDGDEVIGMSTVWASSANDEKLWVGVTGVLPSYRRKGVATALKTRAILYASTLRAKSGKIPLIETGNEVNNPMLQLNFRLGFRESGAWLAYKKWLKPESAAAAGSDAAT